MKKLRKYNPDKFTTIEEVDWVCDLVETAKEAKEKAKETALAATEKAKDLASKAATKKQQQQQQFV